MTTKQRKGPFADCRDDWQLPGKTGPNTKKRAKLMRKPPFKELFPGTKAALNKLTIIEKKA